MDWKAWLGESCLRLVNIPSPSGFTGAIRAQVSGELEAMGFAPAKTNKGSLLCALGGSGAPLILAAHLDTLGAMVRSVKANGHIRLTQIGGYAWNSVENENCRLFTRDGRELSGTIYLSQPAAHVADVAAQKRDDTTLELVLDERVKSAEELKTLGVETGCFVAFEPRAVLTPSGYIKSRHLDDKASAAVLLGLAKAVSLGEIALSRKVYLLLTVQEEIGHGGAAGLPEDAVEILSVDMGCVGEDLGCDETMVSICVKDSVGPYDYEMTSRLIALAKEKGLAYAADVYPRYSSDADAALRAGHDLRHGLIGPGVFASHGYERAHTEGLWNTFALLKAFVSGITA